MHKTAFAVLLVAGAVVALAYQWPASAQDDPPPVPDVPNPDYDVHEWGVVRWVGSTTLAEMATSGWGYHVPMVTQPPDPIAVPAKPVIYFHPASGFDNRAMQIDATITVANGSLREVWPTFGAGAQTPASNPTPGTISSFTKGSRAAASWPPCSPMLRARPFRMEASARLPRCASGSTRFPTVSASGAFARRR